MRGKKFSDKQKILLMGLCGGKCEFQGCDTILYKDMVTGSIDNFANYAHIIASSPNGPRGDKELSEELSDIESNIMVLCAVHHKEVDSKPDKYTVEVLKNMKIKHEKYVKNLMKIKKDNTAIGIKYSLNISDKVSQITDNAVRMCAYSQNYYCIGDIINLSDSKADEGESEYFYSSEKINLKQNYEQMVKPILKKENVSKVLLCAIAPQPLLIYLGTLFSDITNVEVQQLQRESTQEWYLSDEKDTRFEVKLDVPERKHSNVALNISITADISEERIRAIVGEDCDIFKIESNIHGNDIIKTKKQLEIYRNKIRESYEMIKDMYGRDCEISIFPAMPVSIAIETGRCWMKKAHPSLIIYDEKNGFKKALSINYGKEEKNE